MPLLVMTQLRKDPSGPTYRGVVQYQIQYGESRGVPWGVSESGYNRTDVHLNYQYRHLACGPGLKRGMAEEPGDRSLCHAIVTHGRAAESLRESAAAGRRRTSRCLRFLRGGGLYALAAAPGANQRNYRSFMGHHQGMGFWRWLTCCWTGRLQAIPLLPRSAGMRSVAAGGVHKLPPKSFGRFRVGELRKLATGGESVMRIFTIQVCRRQKFTFCPWPLSRGREQCGRRLQPVAGPCGQPVARGCHAGLLGNFYLSSRYGNSGILVHRLPADPAAVPSGMEAIFTQGRAEFRHHNAGMEVHTEDQRLARR